MDSTKRRIYSRHRALKIGVDIKEAMKTLAQFGITIEGPFFDISIASKLLGLKHDGINNAPIHSCCEGLLKQSGDLAEKLKEKGQYRLFCDMEMPLVPLLAKMELQGVSIDVNALEQALDDWGAEKETQRDDCHEMAGGTFNINSSDELGNCLFSEQGLPPMGTTAKGFSTSRKSLELLTEYSPIPKMVIDYRTAAALRTKALEIKDNLGPDDAVHSVFNQLGAGTGRMSCKNPNLHSMPEGVRKLFIPRPGHVFLYADYSQVQSRILAHLSGDESYINLFRSGGDIHRLMGAEIFRCPVETVDDNERTRAKKVVHGITNNEGAARIASDLKISKATAQAYIDQFYESFPGVAPYKEEAIAGLRQQGYVESILGRRCYYDMAAINSPDRGIQGSTERSAFISILQMNEADTMKLAILAVDSDPLLQGMGARMLFSVHDSLLVEVRKEHREEAASRLREVMENVVSLDVPLKVGVEFGYSWGDLVKV